WQEQFKDNALQQLSKHQAWEALPVEALPDWGPPAGQVNQRLLRPAWSLRHAKCVRGLKWCHEVPPNPPPPPPAPHHPAPAQALLAQDPPAPDQGPPPPPPAQESPPPPPAQAQPPPLAQDQPPAQAPPGPVPPPQAPSWGRWLDRDTNPCLNFQRIGESKQRPLELCRWDDLEALAPVGKEYQQGYKRLNDRLPKVKQRLHRAAEFRRGIDVAIAFAQEVATRGVPYQPEMNWQWNGNEAPVSLPGSLLGPVEGGSASNNLWDVEVLAQALQVLQGQHDTHQPTLGTVGPQLDNAYTVYLYTVALQRTSSWARERTLQLTIVILLLLQVMPQEAQSGYSLHNSFSGNLGWPAPNHFMSDTTGHPAERELRAAQQLQQLTSTPEEFLLLERIAGEGFAATQVLAPLLQHRRELMVPGPPAMLPRTATVPPPPPPPVPQPPPTPQHKSSGAVFTRSTSSKSGGGILRALPPSWAGADWNPRAAAQAAISGATGGACGGSVLEAGSDSPLPLQASSTLPHAHQQQRQQHRHVSSSSIDATPTSAPTVSSSDADRGWATAGLRHHLPSGCPADTDPAPAGPGLAPGNSVAEQRRVLTSHSSLPSLPSSAANATYRHPPSHLTHHSFALPTSNLAPPPGPTPAPVPLANWALQQLLAQATASQAPASAQTLLSVQQLQQLLCHSGLQAPAAPLWPWSGPASGDTTMASFSGPPYSAATAYFSGPSAPLRTAPTALNRNPLSAAHSCASSVGPPPPLPHPAYTFDEVLAREPPHRSNSSANTYMMAGRRPLVNPASAMLGSGIKPGRAALSLMTSMSSRSTPMHSGQGQAASGLSQPVSGASWAALAPTQAEQEHSGRGRCSGGLASSTEAGQAAAQPDGTAAWWHAAHQQVQLLGGGAQPSCSAGTFQAASGQLDALPTPSGGTYLWPEALQHDMALCTAANAAGLAQLAQDQVSTQQQQHVQQAHATLQQQQQHKQQAHTTLQQQLQAQQAHTTLQQQLQAQQAAELSLAGITGCLSGAPGAMGRDSSSSGSAGLLGSTVQAQLCCGSGGQLVGAAEQELKAGRGGCEFTVAQRAIPCPGP
ncbi:hypothetical protein QJQ45_022160, partial [Haematococcus lacustris]